MIFTHNLPQDFEVSENLVKEKIVSKYKDKPESLEKYSNLFKELKNICAFYEPEEYESIVYMNFEYSDILFKYSVHDLYHVHSSGEQNAKLKPSLINPVVKLIAKAYLEDFNRRLENK